MELIVPSDDETLRVVRWLGSATGADSERCNRGNKTEFSDGLHVPPGAVGHQSAETNGEVILDTHDRCP